MWVFVCVCVMEGCVLEKKQGNMCNNGREGERELDPCPRTLLYLSHPCPAGLTLGGGFRVTVWDLSWIYKLGERFMSFPPPSAAPLTIHSPPLHSPFSFIPGYTITDYTAHKGLSSQVQPRLARIKERFQLKMFFPFFLFSSVSSLLLLPCFPLSSPIL